LPATLKDLVESILTSEREYENSETNVTKQLRRSVVAVSNLIFNRQLFQARNLQDLANVLHHGLGMSQASDPRDHVYALLGLVDNPDSQKLEIDYNLSVEKVFTQAVTQCINLESFFLLLGAASNSAHSKFTPSLPSWVPDFSTQRTSTKSFSHRKRFDASCGSEKKIFAEDSILTLAGKVIDVVQLCYCYPFQVEGGYEISRWQKWYQECRTLVEKEGTFYRNERLAETWWRLVVCDSCVSRNAEGFGVISTAAIGFGDHYLQDGIPGPTFGRACSDDAAVRRAQTIYDQTARITSNHSSFCSTEKGLVGWLVQMAQPGDKICIFAGGPAPFIIRDCQDGYYKLICDAYIHGIMHGEALAWEGIEWEDIKLR
jgi:hypothetical protein